jgi:hypothetical protein
VLAAALAIGSGNPALAQQQRVPTCDDLNWSVQVLAANPDIRQSCLGVYVRNGKYYARSTIELVRINGNNLTFRPLHRDGGMGDVRRIRVPAGFTATIDGKRYGAVDFSPGQRLNVYIPENRFALAIHDDSSEGDEELMAIEQADVTQVPEAPQQR